MNGQLQWILAGEYLKGRREFLGISRNKIATVLGIAHNTVKRLEMGLKVRRRKFLGHAYELVLQHEEETRKNKYLRSQLNIIKNKEDKRHCNF